MTMRRGANWKQRHMKQLRYIYGPAAERWQAEGRQDDRRLYANTYRMMLEGLRSLPAEPALYVRTAVDEKLRKDRAMLDRIARRFAVIEGITGKAGDQPAVEGTSSDLAALGHLPQRGKAFGDGRREARV